jgi:hypothetical protein
MYKLILTFIATFLLSSIFAQDIMKDFEFEFKIKYNRQDSIPDKSYSLKKNKLLFRSALKEFSGKVSEVKKSKKVSTNEIEEIFTFCQNNFISFNKAFVCKTQSAAEVKLFINLQDRIIDIDFSPCNLSKDLIFFKNFDILLTKLISVKAR